MFTGIKKLGAVLNVQQCVFSEQQYAVKRSIVAVQKFSVFLASLKTFNILIHT